MDRADPSVTVVVVNYRGADDTITCLEGIRALDWPADRLDVVVVDNASGGDDVQRIRAAAPDARMIESRANLGFAGGCNLGVRESKGRHVAFLNNDARPDPGFLRHAVAELESQPEVAAVAGKVLDWGGGTIDFAGGALAWYGQAFKLHVGEPADAGPAEARDILFGTGAALVVRRSAFEDVGGFDERYFMFFEDVDLGWRLWLAGHRVRYLPSAVVRHRHHASMSGIGPWREQYLLERNALYTIFKNYDDRNLERFLGPALALAVRRGVARSEVDAGALDLASTPPVPGEPLTAEVPKSLLASAYAVDAFARELPALAADRARIQASRVRSDAEITRMFELPTVSSISAPDFRKDLENVTEAIGVGEVFGPRRRILVLTGDTLASKMAGPAIRALQMAVAMGKEHDVTLATTSPCELSRSDITIRRVTRKLDMAELERWADVIILQGHLMNQFPVLRSTAKPVVVDIYDPFHLEQLEQGRDLPEDERREVVHNSTAILNEQIVRGDFFLCASEKQRDFWLGQMAALGRVNTAVYDRDETLGNLIAIVPFGLEDAAPAHTRRAIKGVLPGIGEDDKVVLWGGGIYNWFDPLTLIRAMAQVRAKVPEAKLLFMGVQHPNPGVPRMRMAVRARDLAEELGLLGSTVHFNEAWVPYEERQNFLLEADIGVSTHLDHIETAFSFRTRMLDYIWASLPIVCTGGDSLASLVEGRRLGAVVPPEDIDALAHALISLLTDDAAAANYRRNLEQLAPEMKWSVVLEPLLAFCREPRRAADLACAAGSARAPAGIVTLTPPPWQGVRGDLALFRKYWDDEGFRGLSERISGRVGRLARGRLRPRAR